MRALAPHLRPPSARVLLRRPRLRAGARRSLVVVSCVAIFPLLGGEFMPKLEEGNFWIRATLPDVDLARAVDASTSGACATSSAAAPRTRPPCTDAEPQAPRGRHGGLAGRAPRRRHRRVRLLQHRALRAAASPSTSGRAASPRRSSPSELSRELADGVPRRRLQLLADDRRQRRRGDERREGRELGQGGRARIWQTTRRTRSTIADVMCEVQRREGPRRLPLARAAERPDRRRPRRVRALRPQHRRRGAGDRGGHRRRGADAGLRGREDASTSPCAGWSRTASRSRPSARSPCPRPTGRSIPLGQIATITPGGRPGGHLPRGRQALRPGEVLGARARPRRRTIEEAQQRIDDKVHLPYDTHLEWGGEMNELERRACGRLVRHRARSRCCSSPSWSTARCGTGSTRSLVLARHPGRVHGRRRSRCSSRGMHFSVSAAMGFISIFGIAIQDAILVVTYFQRLRDVDGLCARGGRAAGGREALPPRRS